MSKIQREKMAISEEICKLPESEIVRLADLFGVFGDTTRLRILVALSFGELCVNDLASMLGMNISAVSHQLKALRNANLIKSRRDGKAIFYCISDGHVSKIMQNGAEHINEK